MLVTDVCNHEVVAATRDESILDTVKLMRDRHVGSVVVVDDSNGERSPVGILTDRDIVIELVAEGCDLSAITVGDAMSYELMSVGERDEVMDALRVMRSKGIRRVPVINESGGLVGILAFDDILKVIAEQLADLVSVIALEQGRERIYRPSLSE